MTERLYYRDSYLRDFRARIAEIGNDLRRVYLDRTAFYPTSGGQPFDRGTIAGITVGDVVDEEERIAHVLEAPLHAPAGSEIEGVVDWARRWDHMQQHTGQHLLSAVLEELFGSRTVSFHLGADTSTIDVTVALEPRQIEKAEERCAAIVAEALPVTVAFEEAAEQMDLRKASERKGTLRIIAIQGVDRSACGGTHVRSTSEIGLILIRKTEKVRNTQRLEFVCGGRALCRAREDYQLLASVARTLSAPLEQSPHLVAGLIDRNKALEKTTQKLALELARQEGHELYRQTDAGAQGLRLVTQRGPIDDVLRARAQAFVANPGAVFLAVSSEPPSVLLACSPDSGIDAGARVKAAVAQCGGRGGGTKTLAQGSAPDLEELVRRLDLGGSDPG